jgi:hypothetical protein
MRGFLGKRSRKEGREKPRWEEYLQATLSADFPGSHTLVNYFYICFSLRNYRQRQDALLSSNRLSSANYITVSNVSY